MIVACGLWLALSAMRADGQTQSKNPQRTRAEAQRPPVPAKRTAADKPSKIPTTIIQIELLTGADASSLKSYEWNRAIEELKVSCTVRRGKDDDKPGVTEKTRGDSYRQVNVVGRLDRGGRLVFPDRAFTLADTKKLAEWIDELRTYGAQGAPEGQRVWGLTEEQFGGVYASLAAPIEFETQELSLVDFLQKMQIAPEHPLRVSEGAKTLLRKSDSDLTCNQSLKGFAQGTALAYFLSELGLGFRPERHPNGKIDLAIVNRSEIKHVWPVGWYRVFSPAETAPSLFEFHELHFADVNLESVLIGSTAVTRIPVLIDRVSLREKEIDLSEKDVDFPLKRISWAQAYDRMLSKVACRTEVLIDEAGKPFVFVSSLHVPSRKPN